jgi:hypothetical protein
VCHCRLLLWCRFKTRKGLAGLAGAGTFSRREWLNGAVRERRCSYALCPQHSSNTRWHLVTPYTNAGGKDWSELVGQTLCSCCFQQYRGKVCAQLARACIHGRFYGRWRCCCGQAAAASLAKECAVGCVWRRGTRGGEEMWAGWVGWWVADGDVGQGTLVRARDMVQ